jgi:hypothetical protein
VTPEEQAIVDREHLRLLALFHYISGGMTIAFGSMFGIWFGMMSLMFSTLPVQKSAQCVAEVEKCGPGAEALEWMPGIFLAFFGLVLLLFLALGVLEILAGWFLSKHRRRMFSIIVSIPGLIFIPYGTILSIFTIIVLERASVKALFEQTARGGPA